MTIGLIVGSVWSQRQVGGSVEFTRAFLHSVCRMEPIPGVIKPGPCPTQVPALLGLLGRHTPIHCRGDMLLLSAKYCAAFSQEKSSFNCSCFSYRYYKHPTLPSTKAPPKQAGWVTAHSQCCTSIMYVCVCVSLLSQQPGILMKLHHLLL